ncbi:fumarylacetoacetate hydrolase family protein [Cupriavidus nantongensis]|uniref:fumarylacetoacetate hydrolase family protein n=1 Tax=Cupriavidus nantongensis TaxID=1796606 RepID=UPI00358F09E2
MAQRVISHSDDHNTAPERAIARKTMRFFSHRLGEGSPRVGAYRDGVPVDLGPGELSDLLRTEDLAAAARRIASAPHLDESTITLLPVIARPSKILCVGLNYVDHRAEAAISKPAEYPDFFVRFSTTLVACDQPIRLPSVSGALDYEGELAVVIGRGGRYISRSDAHAHIAGYSVFNDATLRDYQFRSSQWTWGKNFDDTGAFGPVLVTPDELPRPVEQGLKIETRLNGEMMQSASTADLIFNVATLISQISEAVTLEPGDVLLTGTPGGVGMARQPQRYMRAGDLVEVEIEGIGTLRNRVEPEARP